MKYAKLSVKTLPRVMYAHECVISEIKSKQRTNVYHELTFVESGKMTVKCETLGIDEVVEDGFFFALANIPYETTIEGEFKHSCIAFFDDDVYSVCDESDVVYKKSDNTVVIELEDIYIPIIGKSLVHKAKESIARVIEAVNNVGNEEYANLKNSYFALDLLLSLAKRNTEKNELPSEKYYVDKINKYIASNYSDPEICMSSIAEAIGLHPNYISGLYKKVTGASVMSVVKDTRISQAKNLLRLNKYLVKDVAKMVGFTDCNYFSTTFRKTVGVRAEEYYKQ